MTISTVITAAGKNSRMRKDQISRNIELRNKLILPFKDKTVIETTIDNACKELSNTISSNIQKAKSDSLDIYEKSLSGIGIL